ncbi:MAG: UDP-N-acetylglucosamine 4,6-dehydratase (inverting) [Methanomicrobiales archaeon]|nr:UDP-N-acetylglucosamine 4,6-dehydratase (inverting) [Methanomicrobiales archaeon]
MDYSLSGKTLLVTGGTGSFGQKFTETVLRDYDPKAVRIFSRGELLQIQMEQRFDDERLRFFIGDVRDPKRLARAMTGADVVVHAAALKHVPACEYNPIEAIRTNVDGTLNLIDSAIDSKVDRVMLISTDKAVHPVNLYGATKMVAEKVMIQGNSYTGGEKPRFSCVRYGNVIGSRGSVIPLFLGQKTSGRITITDERMTRFWIQLEQGVRFVISSLQKMQGGEIFIPRLPSMRLMDLADAIAPEAEKVFTGVRPGEKIHEVLITGDEARRTREFDDFYVIDPEHSYWGKGTLQGGRPVAPDFSYSSETNTRWLSKEDLRGILKSEGWI